MPLFLFAQKNWQFIPPKYEPEHIRLNNTEDLGYLSDIKEDNEGYFWLSGQRGLNLFDGNRLTTFRNGNEKHPLIKELNHRPLICIIKDDSGKFWIQEDSNRCILFNPVTRKTESIENDLAAPGDEILTRGIMFIKHLSVVSINKRAQTLSILIRKEKNKAEQIFKINMDTRRVMNYFADSRNHWILTKDSILRVSSDGKEHKWYLWPRKYFLSASIFNNNFYIPDFNSQFIYTWNQETDKLEPWLHLPDILKDNLYYFTINGDEVVFANNLNCYILNIKTKTIQDLTPDYLSLVKNETPEGLSADVQKIILKSDNNLYICTNKNLYRLKKKNPERNEFEQPVEAKFKLSDAISYRGLAEDENKNIYVTYYNGISVKKNGSKKFITYRTPFDIGGQSAVFHLSYYKGKLYWSNAEIDLKTGRFQYMAGNGFAAHTVHYISNDTLWFYSWHTNELYCYDLKKSVTTSNSFDKEVFEDIFTDEMNDMIGASQPGHLWISTRENGLMLITASGRLIKKYTANELQLSSNFISDLERQDSILWFGCNDGLGMLNTYTGRSTVFKSSYVNNNAVFQNRVLYSILPDEKGNLYLGTNSGLLYFDTRLHEFYNLPEKHPLSRMEFNRASAFHSSDNHFYFGTTDGLFAFTPAQLEFVKSSGNLKPVKLYAVSIFDSRTNKYKYRSENLDALQQLELQPYENNIGLDFSVPEFYGNVYYSYRVKGFGDQWKDFKPENASINLYGLLPGDYTLEVKASTGSSEMHASTYSLTITVKQVWYKKLWVILLSGFFVLGIISLLLRYRFISRLKRQKELAVLRTRISSDLHDDVGTILSGLAMQSQVLAVGARDEMKNSLLEISSMSHDAMERMRDTVWAIDSRKDKFENLVNKMRDYAEKTLALKNITHEFNAENIEGKKFISPEKRQNIYLIFKEAITNITKHSDARHVKIYFTDKKDTIELTVQDNGTQKHSTANEGQGIDNMQMRAEKIGGKLRCYYEAGYRVELIITAY